MSEIELTVLRSSLLKRREVLQEEITIKTGDRDTIDRQLEEIEKRLDWPEQIDE